MNVSWLLNGTEVQINESVTEASYTNTSPAVGTWNVSAVATNENGTVMQTWIRNVSPQETPTPSPSPLTTPAPIQSLASNGTPALSSTPIFIFGYVSYENGYPCNNSIVNVNEWQAETLSGYNYYQIVLANGTDINASEILQFNVTDDVGNTANYSHSIKQNDINKGIFQFDLTLPIDHCRDFTITNLTPSTFTPVFGDNVTITATIVNIGGNGSSNVTVGFYLDNKSFANRTVDVSVSGKSYNATVNWIANITGQHSITAEVAPLNDTIMEINESNNNQTIQIFVNGTDLAVTDLDVPCKVRPCFVNREIPINVTIANLGAINATNFTLYLRVGIGVENTSGSVFFNKTFPGLNSGDNATIPVNWTPKAYHYYTITASIPHNYTDNNNTNNEMWKGVPVYVEYEFAVDNVNVANASGYPSGVVREGENVSINATIRNLGVENGAVNVSFFVNSTDFVGSQDERYIEIGRAKKPVFVEVGNTTITSIPWSVNVTGGDHLIYAVVNPDKDLTEWPQETHTLGKSIILKNQTQAGNNVKNCALHVLKPDLKLKSLTLDPPKPVEDELVNVSAAIKNEGEEKANGTVWFFMEYETLIEGDRWGTLPVFSLSLPENASIRAHFITNLHEYSYLNAYVDNKPVDLYVKSRVEADGQPIRVSQINASTPCLECPGSWTWDNEHNCWVCDVTRQWQDVWTEWGHGKRFEVKVGGCYKNGLKVKYQVRLGNRTVTLDAGENGTYSVTWNTSLLPPGENYTLMANLEDEVVRNETFLDTTDLAVTNLSVEKVVLDGNQGWINATVKNVGRKNATNFTVNLTVIYEPENAPLTTKIWPKPATYYLCKYDRIPFEYTEEFEIERLSVNESWNENVSWNASIKKIEFKNALCCVQCRTRRSCYDCSWSEIAKNYTIKAEIIPLDNVEVEEGNNVNETKVHVKRSRDFSITNLSFIVNNNETRAPDSFGVVNLELGENVTLNATLNITNPVKRGGTVNVSFYIDEVDAEHEIGNISTNFSVNETKSVEFNWTKVWNFGAVNVADDHNMTVVVDPENKIHELNESNNKYIQKIHVRAPELTVTNLSFDPVELPEEGDIVNITVTIANCGDKNVTNVTLTVYDWADRHIENVAFSGFPSIEVKRGTATAMRLYLDLEIEELLDPGIEKEEGGEVCIYDSTGRELKCYNHSFHGWTPWILDNNITVKTIKETKINRYLFCWDNVPGNESERLLRFLTDELELDWAENAEINKTDDGRTIQICAENHSANLTLDVQNETATLELNDGGTFSFVVKEENKIYKRESWNTGVYASVSKVYYLNQSGEINTATIQKVIERNKTANITVNWTASPVGERLIAAIIDPGDNIPEYNELNNTFARYISVRTADLFVSNLSLWLNGTKVNNNTIEIKHGDIVNITANITNIGVENASRFNVSFLVDDVPLNTTFNSTCLNLTPKKSINNASAIWTAAVGTHVIKVEADYENEIVETNETNNIAALEIYVHGAALSGNTSRESRGLHGEILFDNKTQLYDEDDVNITAVINNSGRVNATNFSVVFYFDGLEWWNYRIERLDVNSTNVSTKTMKNVTAGTHTVLMSIDREGKVPEDVDDKRDNQVEREMEVLPTRDFTIMNVTVTAKPKENFYDADTTNITANVTNVGYRNGTTEVRFLDYENETRMHKYYLNNSLPRFRVGEEWTTNRWVEFLHLSDNLAYLPVLPGETLSSQDEENLTVVHRPGVDAIQLHFDYTFWGCPHDKAIPAPEIDIFDETGVTAYYDPWYTNGRSNVSVWVQGETAYIYMWYGDFTLTGYTTMKVFPEENVTLNASVEWDESGNITAMWSESKNITTRWNASTGDHNVTVIIDPDDEISERNETNSTYVLPLSVNASKELEIVALHITPLHPTDGEEVNIRAVVQNKGIKTVNSTADLWMDTLKDSSFAAVPNDWNINVGGKTRYISLLNHTELSLAPGEEANMTATWEYISVYGNPTYIVRAIVDPLDRIDEMNESNNENNTEIIMDYPDFTVVWFNAPTRERNASVNIKNIGEDDASNVTVLLELLRHKLVGYTGIPDITNTTALNILEEGASRIRVRFLKLDLISENAFLVICDKDDNCCGIEEQPGGEFWAPWVTGDTILIYYCGADFYIDEIEWGDEYNTAININASESVNVSLPESPRNWNKYEGLAFLNATVDPDNREPEQREDNNNRNTTIYVDLVPKGMEYIYSEDGKLKGITATILNNDTVVEEGKGIAFPVYDFNVSLEVRPWNNETVVYEESKRIDINQTIYGGEEREVPFDVNESKIPVNRTYNFTVVADSKKVHSWGEIEERNDTKEDNEDSETAGPDISVGEIYTELIQDGSCKCYVGAVIKNEGKLRATDFDVKLVLNCTSKNWNETSYEMVGSLSPNNETELIFRDIQVEVKPNETYAVEVIADLENTVVELNEWNNENEPNPETIGPDLSPGYMEFYFTKKGIKVQRDKIIVGENLTVKVMVENAGKVSASDFNVAINVSNVSVSSTNITCFGPREKRAVELLQWTPLDKGFHTVTATVDIPDDVVNETDEYNNTLHPITMKVGDPNYRATKPLDVFSGTVYGGAYYDASGWSETNPPTYGPVTFENNIPADATPVYARLYLYLWGRNEDPDHPHYFLGKLPEVTDMEFIVSGDSSSVGSSVPPISKEFPDASSANYTYATYAYNIPQSILSTIDASDSLKAKATFNGTGVDLYAVSGMGLFVAYNDSNGLLTNYYIGEGGDIIMATNDAYPTGFKYEECTSNVEFNGVDYPQLANATLITVLSEYEFNPPILGPCEEYNGTALPLCDLLLFNNEGVGEPIFEQSGEGHFWKYHTVGDIALMWDEERGERGEYVDVEANNLAKIRSRGSYFFLTNAFLKVTYPPDLEPYVKTSLSATVGNRYDIEVDINNLGLSKAKNFTVIVSIDGVEEFNETIDKIKEVGQDGSSIPLRFEKKAPWEEGEVEHNVTVKVDTEDNVKELINEHGRGKHFWESNGEDNNEIINEMVTVKVGPPGPGEGGRGGGTGGGWGTGTGEGEGAGEGEGEGTGGAGGEGAAGGKGGKLIRGYLMKGVVASSEEEGGGGGKGEFSLVRFLMQLAMLAVAGALVGVGYLHERRRQNNKLSLEKKV